LGGQATTPGWRTLSSGLDFHVHGSPGNLARGSRGAWSARESRFKRGGGQRRGRRAGWVAGIRRRGPWSGLVGAFGKGTSAEGRGGPRGFSVERENGAQVGLDLNGRGEEGRSRVRGGDQPWATKVVGRAGASPDVAEEGPASGGTPALGGPAQPPVPGAGFESLLGDSRGDTAARGDCGGARTSWGASKARRPAASGRWGAAGP